MAMKRFTVSIYEDDMEMFEAGRSATGMNKSAYLRLLISEHENSVPSFIRFKEIISGFSEMRLLLKQAMIGDRMDEKTKMEILERLSSIDTKIDELLVQDSP